MLKDVSHRDMINNITFIGRLLLSSAVEIADVMLKNIADVAWNSFVP